MRDLILSNELRIHSHKKTDRKTYNKEDSLTKSFDYSSDEDKMRINEMDIILENAEDQTLTCNSKIQKDKTPK